MKRGWIITYVLLFALFAFSRFYNLTDRPLHNDEGVNGHFTNNLIRDNSWKYDPTNFHGPTLYYFQLIPSWINGFFNEPTKFKLKDGSGLTIYSMRFVVAAASLIALAGFIYCGNLLGAWGSFAALVLAGTSCNFLYFSRYYIHESYVVLFTFGVLLGFHYLARTGRPLYLYLAVLSATLLFCSKETGILHLFALAAAYFGAQGISDLGEGVSLRQIASNGISRSHSFIRQYKRPLLYSFLMAVVVWALLFSSFFKNFKGLKDSFMAYVPWTKQGLESGHVKVWSYFITDILFAYELPLMVFGLLGILIAFIRFDRKGLFLAFWAIAMLGIYSAIPYKTPWCAVNFIFPLALVSGYGVQSIADWLMSNGSMQAYQKRALAALVVVTGVLMTGHVKNTWKVNFVEPENERYKQAYVHTSRDITRLFNKIEEIAEQSGEGKNIVFNCVTSEYWPLPFYLRNYPNAKFWGNLQDANPLETALIMAAPNQHTQLRSKLTGSYSILSFTQRPGVVADLWIQNRLLESVQLPKDVPDLLVSANPQNVSPGLKVEVYPGLNCSGFPTRTFNNSVGMQFYFDSDQKKPIPPPFCSQWKGYIKIPKAGVYRFSLDSDDGSQLWLDDKLLVDNGGMHPLARKSRAVSLSAGFHKFQLQYTDGGGYSELRVYWKQGHEQEERIPDKYFFN